MWSLLSDSNNQEKKDMTLKELFTNLVIYLILVFITVLF